MQDPLDDSASAALFASGRHEELAAHAQYWLRRQQWLPGDAAIVERVAIACALLGRVDEAERLLQALLGQDGGSTLGCRVNLGVLYLRSGRSAAARELLQECLAEAPGQATILCNLGLAEFALGHALAAASHLQTYLGMVPADQDARVILARCLVELGDLAGARQLVMGQRFDSLSGLRELHELSEVLVALEERELAEQVLQQILDRFPNEAAARLSLAGLYERANKIEQSQAQLALVPESEREGAHYRLIRGKLLLAREQPSAALEELECARRSAKRLPPSHGTARLLSEIEFECGRALELLDRCDQAFAAFVQANALIRDGFRALVGHDGGRGAKLALGDAQELDLAVRRAADLPAAGETPVFLVGFPRSGTTLLDQLLDAHPGLQVMEEQPVFEAVAAAVDVLPQGYPQALLELGAEQAARLRAIYWGEVSACMQRRPGTTLVDKYPLNFLRLHLIMTLFPRARWIFAVRHPCDVVLSCFSTNLRFAEADSGFWELPETASLYAQMMGLWQAQRARLQPRCLDVRYEDLVADFESGARRIIDFLELPWHPDVLGFHEHARTRRIATPSYSQVVKPIYRSSVGRWRRYRRHFGAVEALLDPLVRRLGYPPLSETAATRDSP